MKIKIEKTEWANLTTNKYDDKTTVKVYYPKTKLDAGSVNQLISDLPKEPALAIAGTDVFVINSEAIFWFAVKNGSDTRSKLRTSGGLLVGIFELKKTVNADNSLRFSIRPDNGKQNLLNNNMGTYVFGTYNSGEPNTSSTDVYWGLEQNTDSVETSASGKPIDDGLYSDNGIKIEFKGSVMNQLPTTPLSSEKENKMTAKIAEFESNKDTDPSAARGSTTYTLTYKIPADKPELSIQISLNPVEGNFPVSQVTFRTNYNAKAKSVSPTDSSKTVDVAYETVSAPELMIGNSSTSLANVDVNKYFTNSCVKSLFNYEFKDTNSAFAVKTPPGRGQVLCLGAPVHKVSFLCAYPNNDNLPKEAYEDYSMIMTENKGTDRQISMDYSLLKSKPLKLSSSSFAVLSLRLKFIDATPALASR